MPSLHQQPHEERQPPLPPSWPIDGLWGLDTNGLQEHYLPHPYPDPALASVLLDHPQSNTPGLCEEHILTRKQDDPTAGGGRSICGTYTTRSCADRRHINKCSTCDLCSFYAKRDILRDAPKQVLTRQRIMDGRAYACHSCLRDGTAFNVAYNDYDRHIWGIDEPARKGEHTGVPTRIFGCSCGQKLLESPLCLSHRHGHANNWVKSTEAVREWMNDLWGAKICPFCLCRSTGELPIDAYGFEGYEGGEDLDKVIYLCLSCQDIVVIPREFGMGPIRGVTSQVISPAPRSAGTGMGMDGGSSPPPDAASPPDDPQAADNEPASHFADDLWADYIASVEFERLARSPSQGFNLNNPLHVPPQPENEPGPQDELDPVFDDNDFADMVDYGEENSDFDMDYQDPAAPESVGSPGSNAATTGQSSTAGDNDDQEGTDDGNSVNPGEDDENFGVDDDDMVDTNSDPSSHGKESPGQGAGGGYFAPGFTIPAPRPVAVPTNDFWQPEHALPPAPSPAQSIGVPVPLNNAAFQPVNSPPPAQLPPLQFNQLVPAPAQPQHQLIPQPVRSQLPLQYQPAQPQHQLIPQPVRPQLPPQYQLDPRQLIPPANRISFREAAVLIQRIQNRDSDLTIDEGHRIQDVLRQNGFIPPDLPPLHEGPLPPTGSQPGRPQQGQKRPNNHDDDDDDDQDPAKRQRTQPPPAGQQAAAGPSSSAPAPRGRGRPRGSKDKAPRQRRASGSARGGAATQVGRQQQFQPQVPSPLGAQPPLVNPAPNQGQAAAVYVPDPNQGQGNGYSQPQSQSQPQPESEHLHWDSGPWGSFGGDGHCSPPPRSHGAVEKDVGESGIAGLTNVHQPPAVEVVNEDAGGGSEDGGWLWKLFGPDMSRPVCLRKVSGGRVEKKKVSHREAVKRKKSRG